MNNKLNIIMKENRINRVLVIDDAYELYPENKDLFDYDEEWSNLFQDLESSDIAKIKLAYPEYDYMEWEELVTSNEFLKVLWDLYHDSKSNSPIGRFFEQYVRDKEYDLKILNTLRKYLESLNLEVVTTGRLDNGFEGDFDIIITDLFLSSSQNSIDESISRINRIIDSTYNKPLLILMSRSTRLEEKSKEFRNKIDFIESMFSIIEKKQLLDGNKLSRVLTDLVENKTASHNILDFINKWREGVRSAAERSINILKTIDIADYKKIKQLMLDAEGESTSSYIIDIMSNLLQYELENERPIIESSVLLNEIKSNYLPRISKDTNLQEIVEKIHCKNITYYSINKIQSIGIGDILLIENLKKVKLSLKNYTLEENTVLLSISPACDLQRCNDKYNAIFLKGKLEPFKIREWIKNTDTSQIIKINDEFYFVDWDLKNPFTILYKQLKLNLIKENLRIIAKLRDSYTLSMQQNSLSQIGRIGTIAPLPASSNIDVKFFYKNKYKEITELNLDKNEYCFSKIYTSHRAFRNQKDHELNKLIISSELCEKLHEAIDHLDLNDIDSSSHEAFKLIKEELYLDSIIKSEGVNIPIDREGSRNIIKNGKQIVHVTNKYPENNKVKGLIIYILN
ncbi:hypothetical protein ABLB84_04180 [Xenorhabdus szentirmaii]|uniref:hypothetical protein n=1 Tax=Xenorhabdus szentirmaii TaxID=290112 RepID=UPI000C0563C0|nr:hypothetical protein [Xenorhabdus szentirmaii]PHM42750.1 hypothetical protein Xszus_02494 [Xenorhabdus szentirmaii]